MLQPRPRFWPRFRRARSRWQICDDSLASTAWKPSACWPSRCRRDLSGPPSGNCRLSNPVGPVSAWLEASVLKSVVAAMAGIYGVPSSTVRRSWFRAFPSSHLLRPKRPARARSDGGGSNPAAGAWNGLSRRQRAYLTACFREDQHAEDAARRQRAAGQDAGPAAQWRRVPFSVKADSAFTGYTGVQERLRAEGWHDAGAGSTLHALARRGLLRMSEDQVEVFPLGFVPRVVVELTRWGARAPARVWARARRGVPQETFCRRGCGGRWPGSLKQVPAGCRRTPCGAGPSSIWERGTGRARRCIADTSTACPAGRRVTGRCRSGPCAGCRPMPGARTSRMPQRTRSCMRTCRPAGLFVT